jgi:hypothetical protein
VRAHLAGRRPSGRAVGLLAVVLVLAATAIAVGALKLSDHHTSKPAAHRTPARQQGPTSFVQTASGRDYRPTTVAPAVRSLLGIAPAPSGPKPGGSAPRELDRLAKPKELFGCVGALAGPHQGKVVPLAVDLARFQGEPAAVIALPSVTHPKAADVWIVGPGCSAKPGADHVRYYRRVSLASRGG